MISLCQLSTRLNDVAGPSIYETVELVTTEASMARLISDIESIPSNAMKHIRHLHIRAPFYRMIRNRCRRFQNLNFSNDRRHVSERRDGSLTVETVRSSSLNSSISFNLRLICPQESQSPQNFHSQSSTNDYVRTLAAFLSRLAENTLQSFAYVMNAVVGGPLELTIFTAGKLERACPIA